MLQWKIKGTFIITRNHTEFEKNLQYVFQISYDSQDRKFSTESM